MKYAAKRIAMLLLTMVIVSFLAFAAFDVISGDPATAMLGTQATAEKVEALREELGLNRPCWSATVSGSRAFSPGTWARLTATASRCGT